MKRELDNLITQMHSTGVRYEDAVRQFKRQYLLEVLRAHRGNQCKAADELGMHRNTLSRTMAELELEVSEVRAGLKRPVRSERLVHGGLRQQVRYSVRRLGESDSCGLQPVNPIRFRKANYACRNETVSDRVSIREGFLWDAQDAYLFDIDGTLFRSRDRIHIDSFASSIKNVTGFEVSLTGIA